MNEENDISSEEIDVVLGESIICKSKSFNDRFIDYVFIKADTYYWITIPGAENIAPSNFSVISSSGGNVYAGESAKSLWTPNAIKLASTTANNKCKIRVMY